ncbi:MAG: hypothetical protein H7329_12120 [Opitutaceae bacterium]|nr:hypothetical protein [Cytophagales bacterium]
MPKKVTKKARTPKISLSFSHKPFTPAGKVRFTLAFDALALHCSQLIEILQNGLQMALEEMALRISLGARGKEILLAR